MSSNYPGHISVLSIYKYGEKELKIGKSFIERDNDGIWQWKRVIK